MKIAVVVVDTINDFVTGALKYERAAHVCKNTNLDELMGGELV